MELFIPDALIYLSLAIVTAFFLQAAIRLATSQAIHKQVFLQQQDMYIIQNVNLIFSTDLVLHIYHKYKLISSVRRQEAIGEKDEEGPYSPVFFQI
ncbi:hypothetical protein ABE236_21055 [Priestia endophytica]|jgi:hypothetical protein|uniref:hypothetical protein n=1 Tax=Priestia endophytica TaxID=135735 RepID=UPI003D2DB600